MKNKLLILGIIVIILILGFILYYIYNKDEPNINTLEHIITIKSNNKEINAFTGSFCYPNICIDKIDFRNFKYDIIDTSYNNKLFINNLDGSIKSIELYDNNKKEFIDINIDYTNEYIITPNLEGNYIFQINAIYQGSNISYYFMVNIIN